MVDDSHLLLHTTYKLEKHDFQHREEANLRLYKDFWKSKPHVKGQFFNWLDGPGRSVSLPRCPRYQLDGQKVHYVGNGQRKPYRVIFSKNGRFEYKSNGRPVNTRNHADNIYVLSPKKKFYIADKIDKIFHHTSFMNGGVVFCAGHLHVNNGWLDSISYKSGHYKPTKENFKLLKRFLQRNHVDLSNVTMTSV